MGKRTIFSTNGAMTTGPYPTVHAKINLKCIIDLNVRGKIIKIIGEKNLEEDLCDFRVSKDFFDETQKV